MLIILATVTAPPADSNTNKLGNISIYSRTADFVAPVAYSSNPYAPGAMSYSGLDYRYAQNPEDIYEKYF